MNPVWREIGRHEAKPLPADLAGNLRVNHWLGHDVEASPKDEAAVAVFPCVVTPVGLGNKAREGRAIDALARRFADAAEMARIARNPFVCPPAANIAALEKAEAIFAEIAVNFRLEARKVHPLIVDRIVDKDNSDCPRAIVRSISEVTMLIFGQRLYGTI